MNKSGVKKEVSTNKFTNKLVDGWEIRVVSTNMMGNFLNKLVRFMRLNDG